MEVRKNKFIIFTSIDCIWTLFVLSKYDSSQKELWYKSYRARKNETGVGPGALPMKGQLINLLFICDLNTRCGDENFLKAGIGCTTSVQRHTQTPCASALNRWDNLPYGSVWTDDWGYGGSSIFFYRKSRFYLQNGLNLIIFFHRSHPMTFDL